MKKSFSKIISVIIAVVFAVSAMACMASAKVDGCPCKCCELGAGNCTGGSADDGIRDIYLVLDISGSMSGTPIEALKDAATTFCNMMLDESAGDNRIAIVTYATTVTAHAFSSDINALTSTINSVTAKGSTNMYDALMKVKELNEKYGRSEATKHVVVMADGLPNESATLTVGHYTSQDSTMYYKHGNAVYSVASGMWYDYSVYSIGFFHNLGGSQLRFGKTLMKDIQNTLYLEVFDPDKLVEAFIGVADCIIGCICEDGCTCGDDYGCCECCTAGEDTTVAPPCEDVGDDGKCNCDDECTCGENCTCGDDCKCDTPPCDNANDDGSCNCSDTCTCGDDCDCGPNCPCCKTDDAGDKDEDSIPQTGDSAMGIAAAAVMMIAGIAFVATKKKEA